MTQFQINPDFMDANILTKFYEDQIEDVAFIALTRFFYDLTWWPSFWPQMTQ